MHAVRLIVCGDAQDVIIGSGELRAHELGEQAGEHEEQPRRDEILDRDHFVIETEDVLLDEGLGRRMDVPGRGVGDIDDCHACGASSTCAASADRR